MLALLEMIAIIVIGGSLFTMMVGVIAILMSPEDDIPKFGDRKRVVITVLISGFVIFGITGYF